MADSIAVKKGSFTEMMTSSSAMLAMGVIGILLVMMVPLPTFILDILLSFSITISVSYTHLTLPTNREV